MTALAESVFGLYKAGLITMRTPAHPRRRRSWPPSPGSTGGIPAGWTPLSVTSRQPNTRPRTTLNNHWPKPLASTKQSLQQSRAGSVPRLPCEFVLNAWTSVTT